MSKRVLLIGKGGYIGTTFKKYLNENHPDVIVDDVSSFNNEWSKKQFVGYDAVYNVSGLAHANARQGSEEQYYSVNGQLPIDVARKAKKEGVPLFIQMSSMIVYGDMSAIGREKMINENTIPTEPTIYGKSKMMAERGLKTLEDGNFKVAIIRPPLIYSEYAKDNFPRLVKFAKKSPIFPQIDNVQSMLYVDNLLELVYLIITTNSGGIYYPQQPEYITTSKIVSDIARECGHKIILTRIFNPAIKFFSKFFPFIHKAFGNITYETSISNHFEWRYIVVNYKDSIRRIAKSKI